MKRELSFTADNTGELDMEDLARFIADAQSAGFSTYARPTVTVVPARTSARVGEIHKISVVGR